MEAISLARVARALGVHAPHGAESILVHGVSCDTRTLRAGDARERDRFHGTLRRDPDRSLFGVPITFLERGIVLLVGAIVRSSHPKSGEGA